MHFLRRTRWLTCFMLVWFSAMVGAATASPLINPQSMQLLCSSAGTVKLLVTTDDGVQLQSQVLECPLCLHLGGGTPASLPAPALPLVQPLAVALQPVPAAHIALRTAAPLPARGPPAST